MFIDIDTKKPTARTTESAGTRQPERPMCNDPKAPPVAMPVALERVANAASIAYLHVAMKGFWASRRR